MIRDITVTIKFLLLTFLLAVSVYYTTYYIISPNKLSENTILYLSSAVLQAYAALIAIPFAIAAIHLQSKYGYVFTNILFKRVKPVLMIYTFIAILSVFSMILSPNQELRPYVLTVEVLTALIPIWYFIGYLRNIILLKPTDIMHDLGYPDAPAKLLTQGKVYDAWNVIYQGFELARSCLLDPALHVQVSIIIRQIVESFYKIDWSSEVREERSTGSLDISGLLFNILWYLPTHIVDPIRSSTLKPDPIHVRSLIAGISRAFISSMKKGYPQIFDEFLEQVYKLAISYYETNEERAWEIFNSVLTTVESGLKSSDEKKAIVEKYVLPRVLCCGLQIYNQAYESTRTRITDFEELKVSFWLSNLLKVLERYPVLLFHMPCLERLVDAIEKDSKINMVNIAQILGILALCSHEKSKLPEYMRERAEYIINSLNKKVLEILNKNKWVVRLEDKYLRVSSKNGAYGQIEIGNKNVQMVVEEYLHTLLRE